jgi:hypothetical protein
MEIEISKGDRIYITYLGVHYKVVINEFSDVELKISKVTT